MSAANDQPFRELRYALTRADIAAFESLPGELIGREKLWLFLPILGCGFALGLLLDHIPNLSFLGLPAVATFYISVGIAVATGFALSTLLLTLRRQSRIRNAVLPGGETLVAVSDASFLVTSNGTTQRHLWTDITVAETDTHVFLMSAPREVTSLPLRAFRNLDDMRCFAALAEMLGRDEEDETEEEPD